MVLRKVSKDKFIIALCPYVASPNDNWLLSIANLPSMFLTVCIWNWKFSSPALVDESRMKTISPNKKHGCWAVGETGIDDWNFVVEVMMDGVALSQDFVDVILVPGNLWVYLLEWILTCW